MSDKLTGWRWTVPDDHPAFAGHFPGRPILPGVVLLDALLHALGDSTARIASAKFLAPVRPGDALHADREGTQLTVWCGTTRVAVATLHGAPP